MEQPPEFFQNLMSKLRKSFYELKQAVSAWNEKLNQMLLKEGFEQSKADPA